jgi:large subunit ribosomal protein L13
MKTYHPKLEEFQGKRDWFLIDAEGQVLGNVAVQIADILRGKTKPCWHPSVDCGDHVVVINAEKVVLTGNKETQKEYIHHTGYIGHLKRTTAKKMREDKPTHIIEQAVAGMIPRNKLKRIVLGKLHVYAGAEHPHASQNPKTLTTK